MSNFIFTLDCKIGDQTYLLHSAGSSYHRCHIVANHLDRYNNRHPMLIAKEIDKQILAAELPHSHHQVRLEMNFGK